MTINPLDMMIERTPLEQAIRLETLRAELDKEGFTVVRTEWLRRLNVEILKRKLENVQ
jgi:hypothetical protein